MITKEQIVKKKWVFKSPTPWSLQAGALTAKALIANQNLERTKKLHLRKWNGTWSNETSDK